MIFCWARRNEPALDGRLRRPADEVELASPREPQQPAELGRCSSDCCACIASCSASSSGSATKSWTRGGGLTLPGALPGRLLGGPTGGGVRVFEGIFRVTRCSIGAELGRDSALPPDHCFPAVALPGAQWPTGA